ncbi:hypothetical protein, partial [Pseudomonas syringae group genomosp. 7]|uniref:hypothetical protein n=1 Tax=Pseudomonas syringae group genomosp. 7 TaxID=251699 RepID=UPI00376FA067
ICVCGWGDREVVFVLSRWSRFGLASLRLVLRWVLVLGVWVAVVVVVWWVILVWVRVVGVGFVLFVWCFVVCVGVVCFGWFVVGGVGCFVFVGCGFCGVCWGFGGWVGWCGGHWVVCVDFFRPGVGVQGAERLAGTAAVVRPAGA